MDNEEVGAESDSSENGDRVTAATAYYASIYPGQGTPLKQDLGTNLAKLSASLGMPVWLLLQDVPESPISQLDEFLIHMVRHHKKDLPAEGPIALVINSPGGAAKSAYELARIVRRRCGSFTAVIPDAAMSAATLLAIGADSILMGQDSALGPLDAQVFDVGAETYSSVLNEVQALERLRAYALESVDEAMVLLASRTGKRIDTLLPPVLTFVADSMRPLLDKIDVVHYNERARILKVAEEYAVRLLRPKHPKPARDDLRTPDMARVIASKLVENYPEHGFYIDREEAKAIGLTIADLDEERSELLEELWGNVQGVAAVGLFKEGEPANV